MRTTLLFGVLLAVAACDCAAPPPPACTAAEFSVTAPAVTLEAYAPDNGCSFASKDAEIVDEGGFQAHLQCAGTAVKPLSRIDFVNQKLEVVAITGSGAPGLGFSAQDGDNIDVGAFKSLGCSSDTAVTLGRGFLVAPTSHFVIHPCVNGPACSLCGSSSP